MCEERYAATSQACIRDRHQPHTIGAATVPLRLPQEPPAATPLPLLMHGPVCLCCGSGATASPPLNLRALCVPSHGCRMHTYMHIPCRRGSADSKNLIYVLLMLLDLVLALCALPFPQLPPPPPKVAHAPDTCMASRQKIGFSTPIDMSNLLSSH